MRFAVSLDRSRVPHFEKAENWEIAAIRSKQANNSCSELYSRAAELFGRDMAHKQSAKLFNTSIKEAVEEKKDKETIRRLFQECRRQYELSGDTLKAGKIFIEENDFRFSTSRWLEKTFLFLYKILSSYGESPKRVALSGFIIIIVCSIFYYFGGLYSSETQKIVHSLPTSLYFSVVTFTTLGYGDFSPAIMFVKFVAATQAISGMLQVCF